jgi:outer membrane protein OmpA-like peptidoglycan-associated protein
MRPHSVIRSLAHSVCAMTLSLPAFASELVDPVFWIVPGGGIAFPPAEFGFDQGGVDAFAPHFGGILGVKLVPALGLEARASLLKESELFNLELLHGEGNLSWFLVPGARVLPFLTAGAGAIRTENDLQGVLSIGAQNQFAWNAGGGVLFRLDDHLGIRVDARRVSYEVAGTDGEKFRPHTEIFAGLSIGIGGRPKDTDGDGIPDRADSCPDTPMRARVDAAGCPIDGDRDGVPDGIDACEGTPAGATVDAAGCPADSDHDSIFDGLDDCPQTPSGARVDAKGCPLDADFDGVYEGLDQCEGTPGGCLVDAGGCPSDTDRDGVCDGVDQCPVTPADVRVDAKGCPIVVTEKETELLETGMIRLQDVNFESGKSTIKPDSYAALDEVGDILSRWPELRIEIGGHTDSQGSEAFNQKLSEDRAKAVLDYLLGKFSGLKAEQLTSAGYGEAKPVAPNDSVLNRAKNRRVEFKVLNTEALRRDTERTRLAPKN